MKWEEEIQRLIDALLVEVVKILGLPQTSSWRGLCRLLFARGLRNLAEIGLTFDRMLVEHGLREASEWALTHWCRDILARGQENVPAEGPLLIISNHPGAYDALVLASQLSRPDLHIIVSDLPFFRALQNFSRRVFFIPFNIKDAAGRMAGMLSAMRYLKNGGAVLLMGSGTIDPDPAVYPGARENLQRWTEAVNLFLRFVPRTRILLATVSHILHPKWAHHPLPRLWREGLERRRVAEFCQVLQQLFHPGSLYVSPRLSFSHPLTAEELGDSPRQELIRRAYALLETHCALFGGIPT
ncbi:MAG: 1-acyl-sn-glycerol-3-phosphate acyltransferase [Anaerolineales bacterium]|nr:1-acyl-sn-glycerol-3-phosphate acyltransferase [Anaerolineales bacterium]MCX7609134.1 1-acyl-sn-glycerol-3-phosphate acyltransferase [Anaerolineales bacterium]